MSASSAWNGRNTSILGSNSAAANPAIEDANPTPAAGIVEKSPPKKSAPPPAPAKPSVWNGMHNKILGAIPAEPTKASESSSSSDAASSPPKGDTQLSASASSFIKGGDENQNRNRSSPKQRVAVVTGASKSDIKSAIQSQSHRQQSKEDEGTTSTAGSSTTNLDDEESGDMPHNNNSNSGSSGDGAAKKDGSNSSKTGAVVGGAEQVEQTEAGSSSRRTISSASSRTNALQSQLPGSTSNSSTCRPTGQPSQQQQGRTSNHHNNNGGRPGAYVRASSNGTGRRRGEGHSGAQGGGSRGARFEARGGAGGPQYQASMPICTFYVRGLCNRGNACSFKHDPAYAAPPQQVPGTKNPQPMAGGSISSPTNVNVAADIQAQAQRSTRSHNAAAAKGGPAGPRRGGSPGGAGPPSSRYYQPRVFDPFKAKAIQMSKAAQDKEDRSNYASPPPSTVITTPSSEEQAPQEGSSEPPFFSIDVECIATGYGHCAKGVNDGCGNEGQSGPDVPPAQYSDRSHRYPGRIAVVDTDGAVLADIVVRPPNDGAGVVSYLTALTGLTSEMCLGEDAVPLEAAVETVRGLLPKNAVLVGQAIGKDVEWLGLRPDGKDFGRTVDICEIFSQRMPTNLNEAAELVKAKEEEVVADLTKAKEEAEAGANADDANAAASPTTPPATTEDPSSDSHLGFATRYRWFSLRHCCINLLSKDIQAGVHDPIIDAKYSLMLFHKYRNASTTEIRVVRDALHRAPITPGFAAEKTPVIDGVCVSAAGYPHKHAARVIWRWFSGKKTKVAVAETETAADAVETVVAADADAAQS